MLLDAYTSRMLTTACTQAENFLQHLDPVIEQLREEMPQAGYDRRNLGQLIGQFMQFQEDALGINVSVLLLLRVACRLAYDELQR